MPQIRYAIGKTNAGGEVTCVDTAGYGGVSIQKSITINCLNADGTGGTNVGPGSASININQLSTDKVTLRGLDIDRSGDTFQALTFNSGTLIWDHVKISNATTAGVSGISVTPSIQARLIVLDSLITNNGNGTGAGIRVAPNFGGSAQVFIERSSIVSNAFGVAIDGTNSTGGINATIKDSSFVNNANDGIIATSSPSGAPFGVTVINSASANVLGFARSATTSLFASKAPKIIGNGTGLSGGGAWLTGGGNTVQANGTNGGFTGSYAQQ